MKSSHSKIFHINVSFYTRLSIANHWGPLAALEWGLRVRKRSQQASNHQTFLSPSFTQTAGSFPIVKSSHSKILYLGFSWHTRLSIRNHWGPSGVLGAPHCLKTTKTCLYSSDIPLSTFVCNTLFSHSEIIPQWNISSRLLMAPLVVHWEPFGTLIAGPGANFYST